MKTKWIVSILVLTTLLISVTATASMLIPANENAKENAEAPENSPQIILTDEGWNLKRIDFIHYAKGRGNPTKPSPSICYSLMGVEWTTLPVNYVINPTNLQGLSETFITSAISTSAETWDSATPKELFNDVYSIDYTAQYRVQNYQNAVVFGKYAGNKKVIAVTSVWYRPSDMSIVEFDILFNTRYAWGDAKENPAVMDLQNIATHELGHGVGLADLYSASCSTVTMYGYSGYGDTEKRTLEQPDITGLRSIYS